MTNLSDDTPETFLNDERYFDGIPNVIKAFIFVIQKAGPNHDMTQLCRDRAATALAQAKQNPTKENYDSAIAIYALTVRYTTPQDPARANYHSEFGHALQARWEFFPNPEDFNDIIRFYAKAVDLAKPDHPALGAYVTDLAVFLSKKYDRTKKDADREEAKKHFLWAIELSKDHPLAPVMISNAGDFIRRTAKKEDPLQIKYLTEACQLQEQAIQLLRPFLALPYATIRRNAGIAYHDLFSVTRDEATSELAIKYFKTSLTISSPPSSMYDLAQNELVGHYMLRQRLWDRPADLKEAVAIYDEQIRRNPDAYLSLVGKAECHKIQGSAETEIESAIASFKTASTLMNLAIEKIPQDSTSRGWLSSRNSSLYYNWFGVSGDLDHLQLACEEAKAATKYIEDPNFWEFSRWYSEVLLLRHSHLHSLNDLENALTAINAAIKHVPDWETENKADCNRTYGKCLLSKYALANEVTILDAATSYLTAACMVTADERGMTISRCLTLNDLGNAYCKKFDYSHSIEDLNEAIHAYQRGYNGLTRICAATQHPDRLMLAAGMGYAMFQRFLFWGAKEDITSAIKHYEMAISQIEGGNPKYAPRVSNLSYALQQKFVIDHNMKHLKRAQSLLRNALAHLPTYDLIQKRNLNIHLGNVYMSLFIHGPEKMDQDLNLAEECYAEAMDTEGSTDPESNMEMALAVMNLAILWRNRAEQTGRLEDFDKSLEFSDRASTLFLQSQNPRLWTIDLHKATTLALAHERYPALHYGEQALELYRELTRTLHSTPAQVIQALEGAASMEMLLHSNAKEAFKYYSIAIEMLPEAIMLHSSRLEQLRAIRNYHTIPSSATALSIQAGNDPKTTVRMLESSRGFIWNSMLTEQSPISRLRDCFPELAAEVEFLRANLTPYVSPGPNQMAFPGILSSQDLERIRRQALSIDYSALLRKIREKNGFEDFLQPSDPLKDLQHINRSGPIVFINFSQYRSDAIVIGAKKRYIPFPYQQ